MNAPTNPFSTPDQAYLKKIRCENRWTAAEDKILFAQVLKANGRSICWRSVAAALPGRNNKSCRKRWIHSLNPGLRKGRWTPIEDIALTAAVKSHGKHWFQVARMLGNGRTDDQCAKRWREALDPNIKRGPWGEHEDEKLIAMFRIHGRKWNDIAASLDGRPPVQCRNRWLSLVRAGRIEDDAAVKVELRRDSRFHPPAYGPGVAYHAMFEDHAGSDSTSGHFMLRRTSWEDHQTATAYDEDVGQPQLYPPAYLEGQYHEQRSVPPKGTTDPVVPNYYPPPHPTCYSPPPHVPTEEVQSISQPVHVVAPTPVNLIIQTSFTRVEHNYHYASQESDSSSGYGSTPPPTTASSTRSSFSFGSADSPTNLFDQFQEHPVSYSSQSYPAVRDAYPPYQFRHQYDVTDSRCYQPTPPPEHGTSPCHGCPDGESHPHETYYPPAGDCGSPDHDCGYEGEPESDRGWITYQASGYGFYTTPNQATEAWRHPPWFHRAVTKSDGGGRDGAYDNATNRFGSVEHPTSYNAHSR